MHIVFTSVHLVPSLIRNLPPKLYWHIKQYLSSESPVTSHCHIQWSVLSPHLDLPSSLTDDHSFLLSHVPHFTPHIMAFLPFQAILLLRILCWMLSSSQPKIGLLRASSLEPISSHSAVHVHGFKYYVYTDNFPSCTSVLDLSFQLQNNILSTCHLHFVVREHMPLPQQNLSYWIPHFKSLLSQFHHLSKWHQHSLDYLYMSTFSWPKLQTFLVGEYWTLAKKPRFSLIPNVEEANNQGTKQYQLLRKTSKCCLWIHRWSYQWSSRGTHFLGTQMKWCWARICLLWV